MRRPVNHGAMAIAGFTVPWSAAPGAAVGLHLSSAQPVERVSVCRLDAPGYDTSAWKIEVLAATGHRHLTSGSFLRIADTSVRSLGLEIYLDANPGSRTLLAFGDFRIILRDGSLFDGSGQRVAEAVPVRRWLQLTVDLVSGQTELVSADPLSPYRHRRTLSGTERPDSADLLLGSDGSGDGPTLNARYGRIDVTGETGSASWSFPTLLPSAPIAFHRPGAASGLEVIGLPTFCLPSPRWDGSSFDPRLVPNHYDAIACHDDDMPGLDWPESHRITVPVDAAPGIYAAEVSTASASESIVFFVASRERRAPLLFVVPTATYLAYADEALPPHLYEWKCEDRGHRFAVDNGLLSLYDFHDDLAGVSICSYRKPKGTVRADYRYPLCGDPHNLPVDLHLLRFLEANGVDFDLVTDHDLHTRGLAGLAGYHAVVTGSHPEYMSVEMEGAIRGFLARGGSLAYLGGNGFAGVVAFRDDLMELRRSPLETGRTWDGPISEQTLAITNEPGGHLRSRGKGEFSLIGGAISLMGFGRAHPFTRTPASFDPDRAWLFDGVEHHTFGDEGIVLGGAAGYEVDATDAMLGTAPDTVVVATANGFPDSFEHDAGRWYAGGAKQRAGRRRAEMTLRHLSTGGMIFSASSVAWCGALPLPRAMNDVGRITLNLLGRLAQTPNDPIISKET